MAYADSDGDYIEGTVQWWWKYVFPTRARFWLEALARLETVQMPRLQGGQESSEPDPHPWVQKATSRVLEGLVMLHAAARADQAASAQLRTEATAKISAAVADIPQAELEERQ